MGHTTDKQILFSIIPKHMYDSGGIKIRWKEVEKEYEETTGFHRSFETLREYVKPDDRKMLWAVSQNREELSFEEEDEEEESIPSNSLEILGDGTQKLLAYKQMSEKQSKDPDYVMKINGYDPSKWELIRLRVNEWTGRTSDNEELYHYQIRLDVKPLNDGVLTKEDIIQVNKEYKYIHEPIEYTVRQTERAMEVGFADMHIGSNQFDYDLLKSKVRNIREKAEQENVDKMYIVFNGDILHVDNTQKTTVKGTQMEMVMSAFNMYKLGKDVTNYIVNELAFVETEVYWVQGNHSRLAEFALFDSLKDTWSANEHIKFDVSELRRKAFLYGKQLVGLYHGDMPKKNRFDWLQRDYRELWGKAKYVEQHSGHYHNEDVESKGAIINRVMPTIKETDDYEYSLGYHNISMAIQTFIYDKEDGLQQINYF